MSGKDIELAGKAAAASHLRDLQHQKSGIRSPPVRNWDGRKSAENDGTLSPSRSFPPATRSPSSTSANSKADSLVTPPLETTSRLLKATFDQVKEELANGRWRSIDEPNGQVTGRPRAYSLESALNSPTSPVLSKGDNPIIQPRLPSPSSRSRIIQSKIQEIESRLTLAQSQLSADMKFIRNVTILTPFQRSTRERLQAAVQNVAKRISQVRLDIEKLTCHRDVLSRDLVAEESDWQRTKKLALSAATDTLQGYQFAQVPRMTLSMYMEEAEGNPNIDPLPVTRTATSSTSQRPESSVDGSFHSALDFGSDWSLGFPHDRSSGLLDVNYLQDTPNLSYSPGSGSRTSTTTSPDMLKPPPLSADSSVASSTSTFDDPSSHGHEKFYSAPDIPDEHAEDWNKTRAAKRVSLVRVPHDLKMSKVLGRHMPSDDSRNVLDDTQTISVRSRSRSPGVGLQNGAAT